METQTQIFLRSADRTYHCLFLYPRSLPPFPTPCPTTPGLLRLLRRMGGPDSSDHAADVLGLARPCQDRARSRQETQANEDRAFEEYHRNGGELRVV